MRKDVHRRHGEWCFSKSECSPRIFGEQTVKSGCVDVINIGFEETPIHINLALESVKQRVCI